MEGAEMFLGHCGSRFLHPAGFVDHDLPGVSSVR